MKTSAFFPIMIMFLLLGSCQQVNLINHADSTSGKPDRSATPTILFFYTQQTMDKEDPYYEALFDITDAYPDQEIKIEFLQSEKNHVMMKRYEIIECPTLIITQGEKVTLRIGGKQDKSFIFQEIKKRLNSVQS